MSLTHYLSEVKERAEKLADPASLTDANYYRFLDESQLDVERLVRICEAQAEALENIGCPEDPEAGKREYWERFKIENVAKFYAGDIERAREALSTAELIAKGEK